MDRRDFFQTIFITPLLTPFLLASRPSQNDVLFLIDNHPETILPPILKEMEKWRLVSGRYYSFRDEHPQKEELGRALRANGWRPGSSLESAGLVLSFRPLRNPVCPSFTLVRSGKICDIRSSHLHSLWREMNLHHVPSTSLTILSFQAGPSNLPRGESVRIYRNGEKIEEISLKKDLERTFQVPSGIISIRIQGGKIWVPDSSCPQKICCSAHPVSTVGERIVCAPNHFLLEVSGSKLVDTIIG
jgi:hypothetical protein